MSLTPATRRVLTAAIVVLAGVAGALTFAVPADVQLGAMVRLPIFHGASTWVNMALFAFAGIAGLAYAVTRRDSLYAWASAFRYLAVPWWIVNTILGIVSMRLLWNVIDLSEPKLLATFGIMLGGGVVLAIDFGFGKRLWTGLADAVLAVGVWALLLSAREFLHPDNPVMNSGPEIQIPFFGIVGSLLVAGICAAVLIASRIPAEEG
jgi:hypothetical protein